jgi:dipeptidyl-peptidase-4
LVDVTERVAENKPTRYAMAGMTSEQVKLAVYNPTTKATVYLKTGEPKEQYLTNVTWSPDEKYIYIQVLNRGQNHMKMNQYDAKTGDFVKTLFEEKHDKYVEPEHHIVFLKNKPNEFLYFSEKDDYQHLYKYNTEGTELMQLTKGSWIVKDFIGFNQAGTHAIVYATKNSPLDKQAFTVNLENGEMTLVTPESGQHSIFLNPNADVFVDGFNSISVPRNYTVKDLKGKKLSDVLTSPEKLKDYQLGDMTIGTIKSTDNKTDLVYRLITPPNFDKNKKYPAIIYVYGGPHAQLIENSWLASSQLWLFYLAQKGYVVYTVDNRGSANRGFEFENVIHRNLGDAEMADQIQGVEFLKSLGYVDMDRIGVDGWSYGGFMTTNLMLTYPDVFKVGAAGGPVIDWKYYEIMYGERYMDMPEENKEGYEKANLSKRVKDLEGRLMIIHGAQDPTVVWQHSQVFVRECVKEGVLLDYFIYPTHEHNVRGKDRVHLMRKITQYFDDFL